MPGMVILQEELVRGESGAGVAQLQARVADVAALIAPPPLATCMHSIPTFSQLPATTHLLASSRSNMRLSRSVQSGLSMQQSCAMSGLSCQRALFCCRHTCVMWHGSSRQGGAADGQGQLVHKS